MDKHYLPHRLYVAVTSLLIFTGILLNNQEFRELTADFRIYIRQGHILIGILFLGMVTFYSRKTWNKYGFSQNGSILILSRLIIILMGMTLCLTGLLLWVKLPITGGLPVLTWHRTFAILLLSSVVYHVIYQVVNRYIADKDKAASEELQVGRREFIHWISAFGAFASGVFTFKWLGRKAEPFSSGRKRFKNCNKMVPAPTPGLGSVPPIGGGYSGEFEVFTVTPIPCANSDQWSFRLFGLVDQAFAFDWRQFSELPRKVQVSNFHCITGWSVYHVTYEGISLSRLLEMGRVQPGARYLKFYSSDGVYTSALSLEQARLEDVMIALLMDGEPIPSDLGGPARLIVPKMYAYKGVKWVNAVEVIAEPHMGFWESRGYENDAWVKGS